MTLLISHRLSVRFRDCDALGHVNNAVYLTYLEQARFALWRAQLGYVVDPANGGPSAKSGQGRGTGFILARVECDFRAQPTYGDELEVQLSLIEFGRSSFRYAYKVVNTANGQLVAEATTVQVWYDYDAKRPVPIPDDIKVKLATPV